MTTATDIRAPAGFERGLAGAGGLPRLASAAGLVAVLLAVPSAMAAQEQPTAPQPPAVEAQFDAKLWGELLAARDLAERERAFEALRRLASESEAARRWVRAAAQEPAGELAWTCRLLARAIERDGGATGGATEGAAGAATGRGARLERLDGSGSRARAAWTELLVDPSRSLAVVPLELPTRGGALVIRTGGGSVADGDSHHDLRTRRRAQLEALLDGMDLDSMLAPGRAVDVSTWQIGPNSEDASSSEHGRRMRVIEVERVVERLVPMVPWARHSALAPAPTLEREVEIGERFDRPVPPADVRPAFVAPGFGRLGVRVPEASTDLAPGDDGAGLLVTAVEPMSLAHVLGIAAGDRVLAIDGVPIHAPEGISRAMRAAAERGHVRVRWRSAATGGILERGFVAVAIGPGVAPILGPDSPKPDSPKADSPVAAPQVPDSAAPDSAVPDPPAQSDGR